MPYSYYYIPYNLPWRGITWGTIDYDNLFEMQATIGGACIVSFCGDDFSSEFEYGIAGCAIHKVFPEGCEIDYEMIDALIDFRTHTDFICECISKCKILALKSIGQGTVDVCFQY